MFGPARRQTQPDSKRFNKKTYKQVRLAEQRAMKKGAVLTNFRDN